MKRLFKVEGRKSVKYFDRKAAAKEHRDSLELLHSKLRSLPKDHSYHFRVRRGPDHWRGES